MTSSTASTEAARAPAEREPESPVPSGAAEPSLEAVAVFHVERLPLAICRSVRPPLSPGRGAALARHSPAEAFRREVAFRIDALAPPPARGQLEAIRIAGSVQLAPAALSEAESPPPRRTGTGRLARASAWPLLALLWIYRRFVSPVLPPACRYHPSCSQYAVEAVIAHGPIRGAWMAVRRLARCHPWAAGGPDPVPLPRRLPDPERETR